MEFPWHLWFIDLVPLQTRDGFVGTSSPHSCLYLHDLESLTLSEETSQSLWLCDSCSGSRTMLYLHAGPIVFKSQGLSTNINSLV